MKAENGKSRVVYLFLLVIVAVTITNAFLDNKYKPKTNTINATKINHQVKNDDNNSNGKEPPQNSTSNNAVPSPKMDSVLSQQKQPLVSETVTKPGISQEIQRAKEKIALKNLRKVKGSNAKVERDGRTAKSQNGCLVIYNRMPAGVKIFVIRPDGKKIEKKIKPLKSLQMDVPMGVYTIQAMDNKNNPICNGNVTINDELGAAYYVKL